MCQAAPPSLILEQWARHDYDRARLRAILRAFWRCLRGRCNELMAYSAARGRVRVTGQHELGLQTVDVHAIKGTMGRTADFDSEFAPRSGRAQARWVRVWKAFYRQQPLPPVELYKVGDDYFVKDGHHRISVARQQKQDFIEAIVIEVDAAPR